MVDGSPGTLRWNRPSFLLKWPQSGICHRHTQDTHQDTHLFGSLPWQPSVFLVFIMHLCLHLNVQEKSLRDFGEMVQRQWEKYAPLNIKVTRSLLMYFTCILYLCNFSGLCLIILCLDLLNTEESCIFLFFIFSSNLVTADV